MSDTAQMVEAVEAEAMRVIEFASLQQQVMELEEFLKSPTVDLNKEYIGSYKIEARRIEIARSLIKRAFELDCLRPDHERLIDENGKRVMGHEFERIKELCQPHLPHRK